ncbi:tetratricopeptide repeat protein [Ekhidna sp.]|uniref:tetratricopeptide repeat-containing sensor histidine kinase n=1 Tax=Ekhidna sp. TaxID=2608089 RepID=UPI003B513917
MARLLFILFLTTILYNVKGQEVNFDSLRNVIQSKKDTAKIDIANKITHYLSTRAPDTALLIGYQSLEEAKESKYLFGIAEAYNNIGTVKIEQSEYDTAVALFQKAVESYEIIDNKKGQAQAKNNIGHIERLRGNYEKATTALLEALAINEEIGNEKGIASNTINLGIVFSDLKQVDKAIEYYRKAIPPSEKLNQLRSLGNIYNNISIEFRKRNQLDSALKYLKESIQYRKQANALRDLAGSYSNLAILYFYLDKKDSTLILFNQVLETYQKLGNKKEIARCYYNISELHRMEGRLMMATSSIKKSLDFAKEINSKEQIRDAYMGLSQINASLGNFEEAYDSRLQYELYQDSLLNERNNRVITELSGKYDTEKKDKQIAELELEQQTAALSLARANNERNIFIAVATVILLVAILLFTFFRQKRKSLAEKELLLKEIHHRVKNNLQVISSLLNLQADSLESDVAKDAVKEGQNRVKSMALIHQKLYSAEDVRGVDVQDYLENLSKELFKAFGVDEEKINWKVNTNGLKLDIDTIIPLGLIINELITNSIKYAFDDNENGTLEIHMKEEGDSLNVTVADSGKGLDENALQNSNAFGWKMIQSLSRKLKAEVNVNAENGTRVNLMLTRYKLVA